MIPTLLRTVLGVHLVRPHSTNFFARLFSPHGMLSTHAFKSKSEATIWRYRNEVLNWIEGMRISLEKKEAMEVIVISIWWTIWKYRNDFVFGSKKFKKNILMNFFIDQAFNWFVNRNNKVMITWVDYLIGFKIQSMSLFCNWFIGFFSSFGLAVNIKL